jgi:hypothetical protein
MNEGDWVMTNDNVGQLMQIGFMYCQVHVEGGAGIMRRLIVPTNELKVIPKEVADIIRSV